MNEIDLKHCNKLLIKMVQESIKKIKTIYNNSLLDNVNGAVEFDEKLKIGKTLITTGYYRPSEAKIYINLAWFKMNEEIGDYKNIKRTITHEIAHMIHHLIYDYKSFRFPTEGRTEYSKKNFKENFAEAFSDLIENKCATKKRNCKMLAILKSTNLINEVEIAAKVEETKPTKNTKDKTIRIFDPKGNVAYEFSNYEDALKTLQIYSLRDLKYICKRNYIGNYSPRSKYRKFNGYKFTFV